MMTVETAISKTRRALTLGALLRWSLAAVVVLAFFMESKLASYGITSMGLLLAAGAVWFMLSINSVRGSRLAADSTNLIAAGQYEAAEQNIAEVIDSFSIFRTVKLLSLHHLAVLRHAQNRWQESAILCKALLKQRLGTTMSGLDRSSRLILAESLLELGDLQGVYDNLARLYDHRLSLREALNLMVVQTDYLSRISAWPAMLDKVMTKVEMAEMLPTTQAARTQALLALAARKANRPELSDWLKKRVELLMDVQKLCSARPLLWELWGR